jgi:HK97 gp10 family phage protein
MGKMTVTVPTGLIDKLARLGNRSGEVAAKMLNAGINPLEDQIRKNAAKHKQTGEMNDALKRRKAGIGKNGVWSIHLTFDGSAKGKKYNRRNKSGRVVRQEDYRNYQKALALEYGTSKQSATPFMRPAVISSESECIANMQEVFNREVQKA